MLFSRRAHSRCVCRLQRKLEGLHSLVRAGYAVGSLALVADSFHMLKYVSSVLCILSQLFMYAQRCHESYRRALCYQGV